MNKNQRFRILHTRISPIYRINNMAFLLRISHKHLTSHQFSSFFCTNQQFQYPPKAFMLSFFIIYKNFIYTFLVFCNINPRFITNKQNANVLSIKRHTHKIIAMTEHKTVGVFDRPLVMRWNRKMIEPKINFKITSITTYIAMLTRTTKMSLLT